MFVSFAGTVMVTYSSDLARLLHNLPLILVLSTPTALQLLSPATVGKLLKLKQSGSALLCCVLSFRAARSTGCCAIAMTARALCMLMKLLVGGTYLQGCVCGASK